MRELDHSSGVVFMIMSNVLSVSKVDLQDNPVSKSTTFPKQHCLKKKPVVINIADIPPEHVKPWLVAVNITDIDESLCLVYPKDIKKGIFGRYPLYHLSDHHGRTGPSAN